MGHIFYDIFEIKLVNSVAMFTQAQLRDFLFSFIHMKLKKIRIPEITWITSKTFHVTIVLHHLRL